jgi:methionyl-tRNA synthetase
MVSQPRAAVITRVSLNLVRLCAIAAHSIVPSLSSAVLGAFDDHAAIPHWPGHPIAEILDGGGGHAVKLIDRLVEKLSDTDSSLATGELAPCRLPSRQAAGR